MDTSIAQTNAPCAPRNVARANQQPTAQPVRPDSLSSAINASKIVFSHAWRVLMVSPATASPAMEDTVDQVTHV